MGRITGATLFSGGGLFEARLIDLIDFRLAVEFDQKIAAHYRAVYGDHVHCADVCAFNFLAYVGLDFLHASPPCTTASVANNKSGETAQDLAMGKAVEGALEAVRPKVFTLENVAGYMAYQSFKGICEKLTALGYVWDARVYNAADFGVPQTRKRLILRAWRKEYGRLPEVVPTHASPAALLKAPAYASLFSEPEKPWVGWYEAIEDLLPNCPESALAPWQEKRLPDGLMGAIARQLDCKAILVEGQTGGGRPPALTPHWLPSPTQCGTGGGNINRAVLVGTQGYDRQIQHVSGDCPAFTPNTTSGAGAYRALIRIAGESSDVAMEQDIPAPTLTADGAGKLRAIEGVRVVALTPRCLARFQSVPDEYPLPEKKQLAVKIIGNGVPSLLARAIVEPLVRGIS